MNKKQRDYFLDTEGDSYYERNKISSNRSDPTDNSLDPLIDLLTNLPIEKEKGGEEFKVLEIGCGDGSRLQTLKEKFNFSVFGIDPSKKAIEESKSKGIEAFVGTADKLPFLNNNFDIVIYGFCLYLCDRSDLFSIISEADRVLKKSSWLAILDFWSKSDKKFPYHHKDNIFSYKFDYFKMFTWHPHYTIYDHKIRDHKTNNYTDVEYNWVGTTIIRKSADEKI